MIDQKLEQVYDELRVTDQLCLGGEILQHLLVVPHKGGVVGGPESTGVNLWGRARNSWVSLS